MSRKDIADYLGLRVETVSKTLSEPDECGVLDFSGLRQLKSGRHGHAAGEKRSAPCEASASSR